MKLRKYPEYFNTGLDWLGHIPSDWQLKRLGTVFKERREKVSDTDYPALSVTKSGIVPQLENAAKTDAGDNRKRVAVGDFVINSRSDRKGSSGLSELDGSVSLISIVLQPTGINGAYAHYLLRSQPFQEEFYRFGKGIVADLWSTNYSEMKNISLPMPDDFEQTRIAAFLYRETAKIDRLIEKQQRLIKLLEEKRQAVISHTVTKGLNPDSPMKDSGVEWLGEVPEHWSNIKLKQYASVIDCKHITAEFIDEGYPLASIPEVKGWFVNLNSAKKTKESFYQDLISGGRKPVSGDIIYARNASVGEAALVSENTPAFAMGQDVCLIRSKGELNPEFLLFSLKSKLISCQLDVAMVGATFMRINVDNIRNFMITLPPLKEQNEIVKELHRIESTYEALILKATFSVSLLHERRKALISAAVTGKIDVRDQVSQDVEEAVAS